MHRTACIGRGLLPIAELRRMPLTPYGPVYPFQRSAPRDGQG